MNYIFLALSTVTIALQNIFKQAFNQKKTGGSFLFASLLSFFAAIFFSGIATFQKEWQFSAALLPYSAGFGIAYAVTVLCLTLAILNGSLAATSLVSNCSLLLPSFFCILVYHEPVTPYLIVGTVLLLAAIILVNLPAKGQKQKITWKWAIFAFLAFIGNGACSIIQKVENRNIGSEGSRVFMIIALAISGLILLLAHFLSKGERQHTGAVLKKGTLCALGAGFANGGTNFIVMYLNLHNMNGSIMFPVMSAGSMLLIFLWSLFVVKEKFSVRQYIGYAFGLLAIVILNI